MAQGECNCGAVAFQIDAALKDVFVCHCSMPPRNGIVPVHTRRI